jgi:hypothetical protein
MSSRHGDVTIAWGDDEYNFRLGYGELRQLQEACEAGPRRIASRLMLYDAARNPFGDDYRLADVRETIRLGLIGGGKTQSEALILVRKFVDSRPLEENRLIAFSILQPVIWGAKDEPVGKAAESETMEATDSPTTKSPSQPSMELVQQ